MSERSIFSAALDIADPAERAAYLDRACAGDPTLRCHIEDLLAAQADLEDFLTPAADPVTGPFRSLTEGPGTRVGPYKLLEPIGEGGMGEVWVVDQLEPIRRRVALKLIKSGMDSRSVLARFEAERQALALMDHPNIAKVLDAGTTADGRPFFVMELVKGTPITQFCDARKLSPRERLELFVPVCQAIQHAHQKGIIHRDIKPSNVLVELHDDKPVPKVIDFGVAKAVGQQLTEKTIYTGLGALVGTPAYMAPEQANFNTLDVDTRADVYALGVLLYELLAGSPPFEPARLRQAALDEVLRLVREEEPPRPSARLSTSEARASIAAVRQTDPARLSKLMRGELDWIVMKALEKDRTRRYETASGFAADVQRYLADEPVAARPPTAGYRVRKFVRRNRPQVVAAGLVLLALVAGIVGTTWGLIRADRARRDEVAQREKAEANLAFVKNGNGILGSVFAGLDPNANYATVADLRNALRDNLRKAANDLEGSAVGDPLDVAAMQHTLGVSLVRLGEPNAAVELFGKASETRKEWLGADHRDTLDARHSLAWAYKSAGKLDQAVPIFEDTLERAKAGLGPDHQDTLDGMHSLAGAYHAAGRLDEALPLFKEALRGMRANPGADHSHTLLCMGNLAAAYQAAGRLGEALPLIEETAEQMKAALGSDHPSTLDAVNSLGMAYQTAGKLDRAIPLLEDTLERMKARRGPEHPNTLACMSNLAMAYHAAGKLDRALPLFEDAFKLRKPGQARPHPDFLKRAANLAAAYWSQGRLDLSVPLFEQALKGLEKNPGRQHPDTLQTVANLGVNYKDAGRVAEAIPLLEEVYRAATKYPTLRWVVVPLLDAYLKAAKTPKEAAGRLDELLAEARKVWPKGSVPLAAVLSEYSLSLLTVGAFAEAEKLLRECLAIREKAQPEIWNTFNAMSMLGGAMLGQNRPAEAESLLLKGYEGMKAREKAIPSVGRTRIPEALDRLVEWSTATNKPDETAKWKAERAKYPVVAPPREKK